MRKLSKEELFAVVDAGGKLWAMPVDVDNPDPEYSNVINQYMSAEFDIESVRQIDPESGKFVVTYKPKTEAINFDIKPDWNSFIEWAIPNADSREQFRLYVKNVLNGVRNNRMLILHGAGRNGKGILVEVINRVIGAENTVHFSDYILSNPTEAMYSLNLIDGKKICYLSIKPDGKYNHGILPLIEGELPVVRGIFEKPRLAKSMPDFINITNDLDYEKDLLSNSVIIDFPNEFNDDNAGELICLSDHYMKQGVKQWFLN